MPAGLGDHLDDVLAQLGRELLELVNRQALQILGPLDEGQDRRGARPGIGPGTDLLDRPPMDSRNLHLVAQRLGHGALRSRKVVRECREVAGCSATWGPIIDSGGEGVKNGVPGGACYSAFPDGALL
jgi:hypothetical protein